MKRKKRPTAQVKHIPTKSEDINVIASGMKSAVNFNKPRPGVNKYVSKGDTII